MYLFGERGVLVDVLHLITAEVFEAVSADGAAVLGGAAVAATVVLWHFVVIAAVILSGDWFTFKHGVELCGTLQRWYAFPSSERVSFNKLLYSCLFVCR